MAAVLVSAAAVSGFAQDISAESQPPAVSPEESAPEPPQTETAEPRVQPKAGVFSAVRRYLQWAKPLAVRKDFILSTLSFLWDWDRQGIGEEMFTIHWSFLPFMSVGIGLEVNGLFGDPAGFPGFFGVTAQAGFVLPITVKIKTFGDAALEIGYNTAKSSQWFGLNIGFDLGITFMIDKDFGLECKYKGVVLPNGRYQNALGFGWLWNFWL
ncbi:MAG: hypothetical protein LBG87_09210 [Spirochaetaceae bacterium]|nr:hypothetical protein [Spirochaetaceae bacterium]